MIHIVFSSARHPKRTPRVFMSRSMRMSSNCIYCEVNNRMVPIASGTGNLWHVGNVFYDTIEIDQSSREAKERKVA